MPDSLSALEEREIGDVMEKLYSAEIEGRGHVSLKVLKNAMRKSRDAERKYIANKLDSKGFHIASEEVRKLPTVRWGKG